MADATPYPDANSGTGDDPGVGPDRGSPPSTPRWVKGFGIIALVLVLLVVFMLFTGGGRHGPGRHAPSGDAGGQSINRQEETGETFVTDAPPSSATERSHTVRRWPR